MLCGTFEHNVDAKGRLFMPIKFRADLGESFVVTRGLDGCLFVYSKEEWNRLEMEIKALPFSKVRDIQRFLFSSATTVEPDSQGRICIPKILRDFAKLEKNATIIGVSTRVEIWSNTAWEEQCNNITPDAIAEIMEQLNF